MRVLLVNPYFGARIATDGRTHHRAWPPLDLLNCAAILRGGGHSVELLDARAQRIAPAKIVAAAAAADLSILTTSPLDLWQCPPLSIAPLLPLVHALPAQRLVVTGAHGTVAPGEVLERSRASWVLRGEPERLAQGLSAGDRLGDVPGIVSRDSSGEPGEHAAEPVDIESLPLPAYDTVDLRRYHHELFGSRMAMLEASRGCPGGCEFCLQAAYGGSVRHKSARKVVEEVQWAVRCGARRIMFIDLDFLSSRAHAHEVLQRLERLPGSIPWCCDTRADALDESTVARMWRAGCRLVHMGVEFGSQARVSSTGKGLSLERVRRAVQLLREADIESACLFMAGYPGETVLDLESSLTFALDLAPDYVAFAPAVDYRGGTTGHAAFELYQAGRGDEIHRFCASAVRRFYLRPGHVLRHLGGRRDPLLLARQLLLFVHHVRNRGGRG